MMHPPHAYPLQQPRSLRALATAVSYIFHPLFIPVYVCAYLIYLHPYVFASLQPPQKFVRLASLFVITCFFPAITVFLLWRLSFIDSIFLRTQKERIIPFVTSIIYFWWAYYVSRSLVSPPALTFFLLGLFLTTSAALVANIYMKISMHALGAGGAMAYFVLLGMASSHPMGGVIAIVLILGGLICTARLLVSNHTPAEVYLGLFTGILCQCIAYWVIV